LPQCDANGNGYSYTDGNPCGKCYGNCCSNSNTYTNGNADCHYNDDGFTNRNSKHYAQAGSYTTPASYYAAAASIRFHS
jgi:hypothetical protein